MFFDEIEIGADAPASIRKLRNHRLANSKIGKNAIGAIRKPFIERAIFDHALGNLIRRFRSARNSRKVLCGDARYSLVNFGQAFSVLDDVGFKVANQVSLTLMIAVDKIDDPQHKVDCFFDLLQTFAVGTATLIVRSRTPSGNWSRITLSAVSPCDTTRTRRPVASI